MEDLEKQIRELIDSHVRQVMEGKEPPPPEATRSVGDQVIGEYRKRHEKILLYATAGHIAFGAVLGACFGVLVKGGGTLFTVQISTVAIMAGLGLVVMKLWYWTMNTKLDLLRELKLLRLQLLSPEAVLSATGESANVLEDLAKRRPELMKAITWGIFIVPIVAYVLGYLLR